MSPRARLAAAASKVGPPSRRANWPAIAEEAAVDCLDEAGGAVGGSGRRDHDRLYCAALNLLQLAADGHGHESPTLNHPGTPWNTLKPPDAATGVVWTRLKPA